MISFREYLEEATQKKQNIARAKLKKAERGKEVEDSPEDTSVPRTVEDLSFDEFNTDDPHSADGLMGKSFNGNIALLYKNRHSAEASKIKTYFSSQYSPINNNGELVFLKIQPEPVRKKGRNPIIINTIYPESSRVIAQEFFKKIRNHTETDLFAGLYSVLKNQGVFEKPVKKLLKFYLPNHLLDESENKNQALDKIREILLKESIDTVHPRVKEEDDGSSAYLNYLKKDFSVFSYLVSYHILAKTKSARLKQYTEEVMGIPAGERGYSAPQTPPFFGKRPKTNKDEIALSTSRTDSKENVKNVKGEEEVENIDVDDTGFEDGYYDDDEETPQQKVVNDKTRAETEEHENTNISKLLSNKIYYQIGMEDFISEYHGIKDLAGAVSTDGLLRSFIEGKPVSINGKSTNIFKTSLKQIDEKLSEIKIDYSKKDRKEDLRKIRDVKIAGSKVGKPYVMLKTQKGLDKLGRRVRDDQEELKEENIIIRDVWDKRSIRDYVPKNIKSIGSGKFASIDDEMNAVKKDLKALLDSSGKEIVKKDAEKILQKAKDSVITSAENIIYYYRKEISKSMGELEKRVRKVEDRDVRIRKFDESSYVRTMGHYANIAKGDISSLTDRLDSLLDDYDRMASTIIKKVITEKEKIEKITSNPKDYGTLENRAFDRYAEEKLERQKVGSSKEIMRKLNMVGEFIKEKKQEGFDEIEPFKNFEDDFNKTQEAFDINLSQKVIKKYDEIKSLSAKVLARRGDLVEKAVKKSSELNKQAVKTPNDLSISKNRSNLLLAIKEYEDNPSSQSYSELSRVYYTLTGNKAGKQSKNEPSDINFPKTDDEISDTIAPKNRVADKDITPEKAKKKINFIKKRMVSLKELMRKNSERAEEDRRKIEQALEGMRKMSMEAHGMSRKPEQPQGEEKRASLMFKEDVDALSQISSSVFEPYKKVNDNIVILTNRMATTTNQEEMFDAINRIRRILVSKNRPSVITPNYAEKILENINQTVDKIETLLDSEKADASIVDNASKTLDMLITYLETTSSNFINQVLEQAKKGGNTQQVQSPQIKQVDQPQQTQQPEQKIPEGVKPAITTKKIGETEPEENEDEEEEEKETGTKNLLALAKEKLKAGK